MRKLIAGAGLLALTPAVLAQGAGVPGEALLVLHVITFILGLVLTWKASKWEGSRKWFSIFFLFFAISQLLYALYHAGSLDLGTAHQVGTVLLFIGAILGTVGAWKK